MAKSITIYTTNTCAYCKAVKDFFAQKQVKYREVNLDEEPAKRQEILAATGQLAVPVVIVEKDDGARDVTVGFNLPKLSAAIAA